MHKNTLIKFNFREAIIYDSHSDLVNTCKLSVSQITIPSFQIHDLIPAF